ncbi:MAG TPA: hypothetical protein VGE74_08315 [Gemmata sp.]
MVRARFVPGVALVFGVFVAAHVGAQSTPRPVAPPEPARAAPLPVVPASSGAFVTLKVSDLVKHPDLKPVFAQLAKQPQGCARIGVG